MIFANPTYLYLLLLLIPMIGWYVYKLSKNQASLQVSSTEGFDAPGASSWKVWLRHVPFILRMAAVAVLVVILARPQSTNSWQNSSTEGIDIVLAMDISTSMMAQDLKPNRLEASKDVASAFINGRPNDNIGVCGGEFHAMPVDNRPYGSVEPLQGCPAGYNPGWDGDRSGVGECCQPYQG